jgi:hypothetical protein
LRRNRHYAYVVIGVRHSAGGRELGKALLHELSIGVGGAAGVHDRAFAGDQAGEPGGDVAGWLGAECGGEDRQEVADGCGLVVDDVGLIETSSY